MKSSIPKRTLLESGLPVTELYSLAKREGNAKKPVYEIHKWWARRLGHVFRTLLIAATSAPPRKTGRKQLAKSLFDKFYSNTDLSGITVLDPFMGGGTSVVEALKCGARVIGVDIDPVAWFITRNEVASFDEARIKAAYEAVSRAVEDEIRGFYKTRDVLTGEEAEIVNCFWVARITCGHCKQKFDAHPHYRLTFFESKNSQRVFCCECGETADIPLSRKRFTCKACQCETEIDRGTVANGTYECPYCEHAGKIQEASKPGKPAPKRLFAIEYSVKPGKGKPERRYKCADQEDVQRFTRCSRLLKETRKSLKFPRASIFKRGRFDARPISHGYEKYEQLFNARQLYCLSKVFSEILKVEDEQAREYLLIAFSDSLASNNVLVSYAFGYQKATPLFAIHGYQVPQRPVEANVWGNPHFGRGTFSRSVAKMIAGKRYAGQPFEYKYVKGNAEKVYVGKSICTPVVTDPCRMDDEGCTARACLLNRSSVDLAPIPDSSVDLILTDPPFYNNLAYSELSDFYYQWLRPYLSKFGVSDATTTPVKKTLMVRRRNSSEHSRYSDGLTKALQECSRVLRKDGMLVFTFHHRDPAAWQALGLALRDAKFTVTSIWPLRAEGVSGFHTYEGTPKWDSVICCRPKVRNSRPIAQSKAIAAIRSEIRKWEKRFEQKDIPWSAADSASFAFSLALRCGVNGCLDESAFSELILAVAKCFPQKGVANSIPPLSRAAAGHP